VALTGPAAIDWFRERERRLGEVGELLGSPQDPVSAARRAAERLAEAGEGEREAAKQLLGEEADRLTGEATAAGDVQVVVSRAPIADQKQLLDLANRVQSKLGGASAVALGGADGGKVGLVVLVSKEATAAGLSAASVVREAAPVVGGGGGGRDEMAQAGGKDPEKLDEALDAARAAVEREIG
jgi:alanyl-tRNA synthetase